MLRVRMKCTILNRKACLDDDANTKKGRRDKYAFGVILVGWPFELIVDNLCFRVQFVPFHDFACDIVVDKRAIRDKAVHLSREYLGYRRIPLGTTLPENVRCHLSWQKGDGLCWGCSEMRASSPASSCIWGKEVRRWIDKSEPKRTWNVLERWSWTTFARRDMLQSDMRVRNQWTERLLHLYGPLMWWQQVRSQW